MPEARGLAGLKSGSGADAPSPLGSCKGFSYCKGAYHHPVESDSAAPPPAAYQRGKWASWTGLTHRPSWRPSPPRIELRRPRRPCPQHALSIGPQRSSTDNNGRCPCPASCSISPYRAVRGSFPSSRCSGSRTGLAVPGRPIRSPWPRRTRAPEARDRWTGTSPSLGACTSPSAPTRFDSLSRRRKED
jgi:hypothetical protein